MQEEESGWKICKDTNSLSGTLQIRKMSEGYILSIKDVEIICSFYEEAIFGLLIRWIIKEEKTKTVDEIKDTVERIEKLFEGQLDLIISNMKK